MSRRRGEASPEGGPAGWNLPQPAARHDSAAWPLRGTAVPPRGLAAMSCYAAAYELAGTAGGRSKPRKAPGVRKAVISQICAPRKVSTLTACGMKACVLSSQA